MGHRNESTRDSPRLTQVRDIVQSIGALFLGSLVTLLIVHPSILTWDGGSAEPVVTVKPAQPQWSPTESVLPMRVQFLRKLSTTPPPLFIEGGAAPTRPPIPKVLTEAARTGMKYSVVDKLQQKLCTTGLFTKRLTENAEGIVAKQKRHVARVVFRYNHVPRNYSLLRRISEGLPLEELPTAEPALQHEDISKVRFVTVADQLDSFLFRQMVGAMASGVALNVVGIGANPDEAVQQRFDVLLSFLDTTSLEGHDVIVLTRSGAMFVGDDPYTTVKAFVSLSPATPEEMTDVKNTRLRRRMAPIRFSAGVSCLDSSPEESISSGCRDEYGHIEELMATWAMQSGVPYLANGRDSSINPLRYLSNGFIIARVWALRLLVPAMHAFVLDHWPDLLSTGLNEGKEQMALSALYLQLRWWELVSGALDDPASPRAVSEEECKASLLAYKPVLPVAHQGPYGLMAGLIDLDEPERWAAVISSAAVTEGVFKSYDAEIRDVEGPRQQFYEVLRANAGYFRAATRVHPKTFNSVGIVTMPVHVTLSDRPAVDCFGPGESLTHCVPDRTAYKAALGMLGEYQISPLIYYFTGPDREKLYSSFKTILPWRVPFDATDRACPRMQVVLFSTMATRVWLVEPISFPQETPNQSVDGVTGLTDHIGDRANEKPEEGKNINPTDENDAMEGNGAGQREDDPQVDTDKPGQGDGEVRQAEALQRIPLQQNGAKGLRPLRVAKHHAINDMTFQMMCELMT